MRFRLYIRRKCGDGPTWTEDYDKQVGQDGGIVSGLSRSPTFDGDPTSYGKALVGWFNETRREGEKEREFVNAVIL